MEDTYGVPIAMVMMCSELRRDMEKITITLIKTGQGVATFPCAFNARITVFFILVIFKGDKQ